MDRVRNWAITATTLVLLAGAAQAELEAVRLMTAARPTTLVSPPGDSRVFIIEQLSGKVLVRDGGVVLPLPFLTIPPASMRLESSRGFLGMAFDPNYSANGRFYTLSIQDEPVAEQQDPAEDPGRVVVRRYQVSAGDPNVADPASAKDILSFDNWTFGHNAGWIGFNPKLAPSDAQYLFIATGDGGDFNDFCNTCPVLDPDPASIGWAQDLTNNLHGKILRIDVNVPDAGTYVVPSSNPFVGIAGDDEIWAYGLRNPTGTGFDRSTGDLTIGDIGQGTREELNLMPAANAGGFDFGWRVREGTLATPGIGGPKPPGAIDPVYEYDHDAGNPDKGLAVIGGRVYRGSAPELQGKYVFGDWLGRIWAVELNPDDDVPADFDGTNWSGFTNLTSLFAPPEGFGRLQGFGEDAAGELYILENCDPSEIVDSICPVTATDGAVYRIQSTQAAVPALGPFALGALVLAMAGVGMLNFPNHRTRNTSAW